MYNLTDLMLDVLQNGDLMENRTGTNTISVISRELRWDLSKGFPAVTTKKLAWKAVIGELLWFMSGSSSIIDLRRYTELGEDDFCIWQKNLQEYRQREMQAVLDDYGESGETYRKSIMSNPYLGYIYGVTWRRKNVVDPKTGEVSKFDQLAQLVDDINKVKENPSHPAARRLIVDAWDPLSHTDEHGEYCALPPCHYGFQCFVRKGKLTLKWHQRSVDVFLGLPFNIASYAALCYILAKLTGLEPGELIFSGGDVHIYEDHRKQVLEQCSRVPFESPQLVLPDWLDDLDQFDTTTPIFTASDFKLVNYKHHEALKGNMS